MIRILAVDDEKPIAELLRLSLSRAGYSCVCAYDGIEAANLIEKETFDLILLDIMLPGIDGFELMDYIRSTGIPVIFLTAKNAVADRVKGLRMGAEDYMIKPFDVLELLARVDGVLRVMENCRPIFGWAVWRSIHFLCRYLKMVRKSP